MDTKSIHYRNTEHKHHGKNRITRKVVIRGGRGYKSLTICKGGKRKSTVRKSLQTDEMSKILAGKFIPGLFADCHR